MSNHWDEPLTPKNRSSTPNPKQDAKVRPQLNLTHPSTLTTIACPRADLERKRSTFEAIITDSNHHDPLPHPRCESTDKTLMQIQDHIEWGKRDRWKSEGNNKGWRERRLRHRTRAHAPPDRSDCVFFFSSGEGLGERRDTFSFDNLFFLGLIIFLS